MSDSNKDQQGQNLNIELTEEVAGGVYSNLAIITHSNAEFVCDFVQIMPGAPKAKVRSRVILTPQHAKRLMRALAENVSNYEQQHGEIEETESRGQGIPMNFGGPTTQA